MFSCLKTVFDECFYLRRWYRWRPRHSSATTCSRWVTTASWEKSKGGYNIYHPPTVIACRFSIAFLRTSTIIWIVGNTSILSILLMLLTGWKFHFSPVFLPFILESIILQYFVFRYLWDLILPCFSKTWLLHCIVNASVSLVHICHVMAQSCFGEGDWWV